MIFQSAKQNLISEANALRGRDEPLDVTDSHYVHGRNIKPPFPDATEIAMFALGCFWGAERLFWDEAGVYTTAVGYAGGFTPNPTYEEVCSGGTGHAEAVLIVFDPSEITYQRLLKIFWESHDPTQGMRQGNDVGTQYRSAIFTSNAAQHDAAIASRKAFTARLAGAGYGGVTTSIETAPEFYYAETYHQQYLAKNPGGYCGLAGTGCALPGAG